MLVAPGLAIAVPAAPPDPPPQDCRAGRRRHLGPGLRLIAGGKPTARDALGGRQQGHAPAVAAASALAGRVRRRRPAPVAAEATTRQQPPKNVPSARSPHRRRRRAHRPWPRPAGAAFDRQIDRGNPLLASRTTCHDRRGSGCVPTAVPGRMRILIAVFPVHAVPPCPEPFAPRGAGFGQYASPTAAGAVPTK